MKPAIMLARERQPLILHDARTLRIGRPGMLGVRRGRVWLTVDGEAQDRVMDSGERLALCPGHRLVIEPWRAGERAELVWVGRGTAAFVLPLRRWWARLRPPHPAPGRC
jgi:hypothetical protein